jgi:hypothetical protein
MGVGVSVGCIVAIGGASVCVADSSSAIGVATGTQPATSNITNTTRITSPDKLAMLILPSFIAVMSQDVQLRMQFIGRPTMAYTDIRIIPFIQPHPPKIPTHFGV